MVVDKAMAPVASPFMIVGYPPLENQIVYSILNNIGVYLVIHFRRGDDGTILKCAALVLG